MLQAKLGNQPELPEGHCRYAAKGELCYLRLGIEVVPCGGFEWRAIFSTKIAGLQAKIVALKATLHGSLSRWPPPRPRSKVTSNICSMTSSCLEVF